MLQATHTPTLAQYLIMSMRASYAELRKFPVPASGLEEEEERVQKKYSLPSVTGLAKSRHFPHFAYFKVVHVYLQNTMHYHYLGGYTRVATAILWEWDQVHGMGSGPGNGIKSREWDQDQGMGSGPGNGIKSREWDQDQGMGVFISCRIQKI